MIAGHIVGRETRTGRPVVRAASTGALYVVGAAPAEGEDARINTPSLITLLGYAASLAFFATGSPLLGLAGILADELDGRHARASGQATRLGSELDYAVDVTLTGLFAWRALGPAGLIILPAITYGQACLRARGERPAFGSARAGLMAASLLFRR